MWIIFLITMFLRIKSYLLKKKIRPAWLNDWVIVLWTKWLWVQALLQPLKLLMENFMFCVAFIKKWRPSTAIKNRGSKSKKSKYQNRFSISVLVLCYEERNMLTYSTSMFEANVQRYFSSNSGETMPIYF